MSDPTTDTLIHRLATEADPVRRIAPPKWAFLLVVAITTGIGAAFLGPAAVVRGLQRSVSEGGIDSVVLVGLLVAAAGGIVAALAEREPGRDESTRLGLAALAAGLGLVAIGTIATACLEPSGATSWGDQLRCLAHCSLLAAPPTALSLLLLTRSAPGRPRIAALAAGAGSAALGAVIVHLACAGHGEPHQLAAQGLAPLLGAVLTLPFARRLARWSQGPAEGPST